MIAALLQRVQHGHDYIGDFPEFVPAETARGPGRRADADPRRYRGLLRVERDAILVYGDVGAPKGSLGGFACKALRAQIRQKQVRVGASGYEVDAACLEGFAHSLCVVDHSARITLEFRLQGLAE